MSVLETLIGNFYIDVMYKLLGSLASPNLYAEISEKNFYLALLKKTSRSDYVFKTITKYTLVNHQFSNTIIFDTHFFYFTLKQFLTYHTLTYPRIIISLPLLKHMPQEKKNFIFLQATLAFCKTGARISTHISDNFLERKEMYMNIAHITHLSGAPRHIARSTPLLFIYLLLCSLSGSSFIFLYIRKQNQLTLLRQKTHLLQNRNEDLKEKIHAVHALENKHHNLQKRFDTLKKIQKKQWNNTPDFLHILKLSIRKNTWISSLKMNSLENKPASSQTLHISRSIEIQAHSHKNTDSYKMLTHLATSPHLADITLNTTKKLHNIQGPGPYSFTVTALFKKEMKLS